MKPPVGLQVPDGMACKLLKSLYGLKQSGRNWNQLLKVWLEQQQFEQSKADPCLFVRRQEATGFAAMLVYVDDLLLVCEMEATDAHFKEALAKRFKTTDLGQLCWYLGIAVTVDDSGVTIGQEAYVNSIIQRFGMSDAKPADTPASSERLNTVQDEAAEINDVPYRELAGALMWAATCTRPDIAYAVGCICRHLEHHAREHWVAAKRVLRYLKGSTSHKLTFKATTDGKVELRGYCDADWAGDRDQRKSTTGYVFMINGATVSWRTKLQKCVAMSSVEAEYIAAAAASLEAVHLRRLLADLGCKQKEPTVILQDSQGSIALTKNPVGHGRTKHIDVRHHKIRELVDAGEVRLKWISTEEMIADVMTKPLGRVKHQRFTEALISAYDDPVSEEAYQV